MFRLELVATLLRAPRATRRRLRGVLGRAAHVLSVVRRLPEAEAGSTRCWSVEPCAPGLSPRSPLSLVLQRLALVVVRLEPVRGFLRGVGVAAVRARGGCGVARRLEALPDVATACRRGWSSPP